MPQYIDANGIPTNDPGTADSPTTTSVNIAPAGSGAAPAPAPAPAPATTTTPATTTAATPVPGVGLPGQPGGNYQVDQLTAQARQQLADANARIDASWAEIKPLQQRYQDLTSKTIPDPNNPGQTIANPSYDSTAALPGGAGEQLTQQLNGLYGNLNSAMSQAESANLAYSQQVQSAIKTVTLDPAQSTLYASQAAQADAQADYLHKQGDTLVAGAQSQRDLVASQVGSTNADANLKLVQAQVAASTAGPQQDALKAQAAASQANADSTRALIQPNVDKLAADTTLTKAQAGATDANSDLARANTVKVGKDAALVDAQTEYQKAQTAAGIPAASAASLQGQAAQSQASAQSLLAGIQKDKLGPAYGLADQVEALKPIIAQIQQHVFGPVGPVRLRSVPSRRPISSVSSSPRRSVARRRTPPASPPRMPASRRTAPRCRAPTPCSRRRPRVRRSFAGLAGSEFGTLAQMNAYAPKGSTAMAGAFQQLQDDMARRMAAQFPTAPIPNAPPLPAYLQQFGNPAGPGGPQNHRSGSVHRAACRSSLARSRRACRSIHRRRRSSPAAPSCSWPVVTPPREAPAGAGVGSAPGGPTFNPQASTAAMSLVNRPLMGTPGAVPATPATAATPVTPSMPASIANYARSRRPASLQSGLCSEHATASERVGDVRTEHAESDADARRQSLCRYASLGPMTDPLRISRKIG